MKYPSEQELRAPDEQTFPARELQSVEHLGCVGAPLAGGVEPDSRQVQRRSAPRSASGGAGEFRILAFAGNASTSSLNEDDLFCPLAPAQDSFFEAQLEWFHWSKCFLAYDTS